MTLLLFDKRSLLLLYYLGVVDEKYGVTGTVKARAADVREKGKGLIAATSISGRILSKKDFF